MNDKAIGYIILTGSILGTMIYFYLLFISPWYLLTIQVSAMLAVGMMLLIVAWIGYTLASTPPLTPIEELDIEPE